MIKMRANCPHFLFTFISMTELDVISIAQAKSWLELDDADDTDLNTEITGLIKAAVAWVEMYTSHRLWERDVVIVNSKCEQSVGWYPITIKTVKNTSNEDVEYKTYVMPTKLRIRCPYNSTITVTVGYASAAEIPGPLIEAAKKIITYLYENRDIYGSQQPTDVQMLINQYRRAIM